ncbi:MAG: oligosaccharide flippase family protein [Elusimicrobiota bacterium]
MSRARRFARNVGWNMIGQAGSIAVNLLMTPFLIGRMGLETYSLYILLHAASSYLMMMSLGAGGATVKYIAEFSALGERGCLEKTIEYGALVHVAGVAAAAALLAVGAPLVARGLLKVPAPLMDTAIFVLRCAAAGAVFATLAQFSTAVMQGFQRFDWHNGLSLIQSLLMPLGAGAAFIAGKGLRAAACWYVLLNAAICLLSLVMVARLAARASAVGRDRVFHFREFARYCMSLALGPLAWVISFQSDKLFIANALPLSELTLYAVPAGLLQRLQAVPAAMSSVLVPMMSEIGGPQSQEQLSRLYTKSVRVLLWSVLPALVLLFALMPQFLTLWLGADFGGRSVWPARLLVLAQTVMMLTYIPNSVAMSRGKPWYLSASAWGQASISLVAWWWLVPRYQLLGMATGALLAQILPVGVYLFAVHGKLLRLPAGRFFSEALGAPLAGAALLMALVFPLHHLASSWPRLLGLGAAGTLLYYSSAWLLLGREDREFIRGLVRQEFTLQRAS